MSECFKIRVEDATDDIPGKIQLAFLVPYMWFAFYRQPNQFSLRPISEHEKEYYKQDAIERFLDMIRREIVRAWPAEPPKDTEK